MAKMIVELRPRIAAEPRPAGVTPEQANVVLLEMLRWLALPASSGSLVPWPGNSANLEVEYDVDSGLQVRADLLAKVSDWLAAYTAHYATIRGQNLPLVLEAVPESRGIYYYWDDKEMWCSVHLAIYVGDAAAGKEWTLVGDRNVRAKAQIGLRYPMLHPVPNVDTLPVP